MSDFGKTLLTSILPIAASLISLAAILLSTRLAYLLTKSQKEKDYENEYYKKIIESRFAAYNLVEKLLATLSADSENTTGPENAFLIIFWVELPFFVKQNNLSLTKQYDLDKSYLGKRSKRADESWYFNLFVNDLADALTREVWLSADLHRHLKDLFDFTIKISDEYQKSNNSIYENERLVEFGKKHYKALVEKRDTIKVVFQHDLLNLHKVQQFIDNKTERSKVLPVALHPRV
jgi:hypothetical protein